MKPQLLIPALFLSTLSLVSAINLDELASNPADIEVIGMTQIPLAVSDEKRGWVEIPKQFEAKKATIFRPDRNQLGVAEFRVRGDGYVILACHFGYQGNSSGGWTEDRLSKEELERIGWKELGKAKKLGGNLVQSDNRTQTIFYKKVFRGEYFKLRCNKYDPPYPILLDQPKQEPKPAAAGAALTHDDVLAKISGVWRFTTTGNRFYLFPNGTAVGHLGSVGRVHVTDVEKRHVRMQVRGTHHFRMTDDGNLTNSGVPNGSRHPVERVSEL
ncbi:MAG: hypothetical protein AAF585_00480 [Verrucomicrobiota bacterium]